MDVKDRLTGNVVRDLVTLRFPRGFYLDSEGVTMRYPEVMGFDTDVLSIIMGIIPKVFQKHKGVKKFYNCNSYTGKHSLEEHIKKLYDQSIYISNGTFILAMLMLDYEFKPINKREIPNITFNCSFRNLTPIFCECGLPTTVFSKMQHQKSNTHAILIEQAIHNNHYNDTDTEFNDFLECNIERLLNN
jgi:hypothetical protein